MGSNRNGPRLRASLMEMAGRGRDRAGGCGASRFTRTTAAAAIFMKREKGEAGMTVERR